MTFAASLQPVTCKCCFLHAENLAPAHMLARRVNTPTASAAQPAEGRLAPRPAAPQPRNSRSSLWRSYSRRGANESRGLLRLYNPSRAGLIASLWINERQNNTTKNFRSILKALPPCAVGDSQFPCTKQTLNPRWSGL